MLLDALERTQAQRVLDRLDEQEIADDAEYLSKDLFEFMQEAWHIIEPAKKFLPGWHIEAICEHLEAALDGKMETLLITMPPGHMKTLLCSVVFPAWIWTRRPGMRLLTACWSLDFAKRDAAAAKMIIESDWYQKRWPLPLRADTAGKERYENVKRGYRVTTTPLGRATGEGGGLVIVDDPISMGDIHSPTKRAKVNSWLDDVLPTRLRDENPGVTIIVGQRGHDGDPIGHMLRKDLPGTVHLTLPARYDAAHRKDTRWWTDPRTKHGDPLWPELYPEKRLRKLEARMSPFARASQLQQTPQVDGGAIISRDWWRLWRAWEAPACCFFVLSVDPSVKGGAQNDPWAVQLWGVFEHVDLHPPIREDDPSPKLTVMAASQRTRPQYHAILLAAWTKVLQYPEAKRRVLQMVEDWTDPEGQAPDAILIEDKAAGPILIQDLVDADISGVSGSDPGIKDKAARAHVVSDIWYSGRIWVPTKKIPGTGKRHDTVLPTWAEEVVSQCAIFPAGEHDDHVDAATQAIKRLRDIGYLGLDTDAGADAPDEADEPRPESAYGS